jgi:hypothetical protein
MADKLQALAAEKEEYTKKTRIAKADCERITAQNVSLIRTNRNKEETIEKLKAQLDTLREKNAYDLEQYEIELSNCQEDARYRASIKGSVVNKVRLKHKRFEELQRENDGIRKAINEIVESMNEIEREHANEMHQQNVDMRNSRDGMEEVLKRELTTLAESNKTEAFSQLLEHRKLELMVNVKMKDQVFIQDVGIRNLNVRLERQNQIYEKTQSEIVSLNKTGEVHRNALGELRLKKLNQEETMKVLLEQRDKLEEREAWFHNALDEAPSMDMLEAELIAITEAKPYEVSIADMWKNRREMLEDVQKSLRPVNSDENAGHFDAGAFILAEFGGKLPTSTNASPSPSLQKKSSFFGGERSLAQHVGRKSFHQSSFMKGSGLFGSSQRLSPSISKYASRSSMKLGDTQVRTASITPSGSRERGEDSHGPKKDADTEISGRSRLVELQKAMQEDAFLAKLFKIFSGKESVLLSDSASKGDQNMAAWAASEVIRAWRHTEASRVHKLRRKQYENLGFMCADIAYTESRDIQAENGKMQQLTKEENFEVGDEPQVVTEENIDDLLSELSCDSPLPLVREASDAHSEYSPARHRYTNHVDPAERAAFKKYWNDVMGYSEMPKSNSPKDIVLEKTEWYAKKRRPPIHPKPEVSLEFYGLPMQDQYASKYGIHSLRVQHGTLWPPIVTKSLDGALFSDQLGAETRKREALIEAQDIETKQIQAMHEIDRQRTQSVASARSQHSGAADLSIAELKRRSMTAAALKRSPPRSSSPGRPSSQGFPTLPSAVSTPSPNSPVGKTPAHAFGLQAGIEAARLNTVTSWRDELKYQRDASQEEVDFERVGPVSAAGILALAKSPIGSRGGSARNSEINDVLKARNSIESVHAIDPLAPKRGLRRASSLSGVVRQLDMLEMRNSASFRASYVRNEEVPQSLPLSNNSPFALPQPDSQKSSRRGSVTLGGARMPTMPAALRKSARR